jgi:16S rRNA (uracil1498-N3)-methyltransferase
VDAVRASMAELRGEEARHLTRVLRAEPGQLYEISDNEAAYVAEIVEARGDRVIFRAIQPVASAAQPVSITLCAALIKFDRFEWMLEKVTETGVERILPVETARSEKGLFEASRKRAERWVRIVRESSQQSRRVRMPEILPAVRFEHSLGEDVDYRYFLEEADAPALLSSLPTIRKASDSVALLLGPEGGWTEAERDGAASAGWKPVSLSPLVLRTETAATVAVALVAAAWQASPTTME